MIFSLGIQKYFIAALVAGILVASAAALSYRSGYHGERQRRIDTEASLQRTVASLEEVTRSNQASLEAVTRATALARSLVEQRTTLRERTLTAPNDQDGPVAPVLRDAVNGVR